MAGNARAMRRSAFRTARGRKARGGCPCLCGGQNKSGALFRGRYGDLPVRGGSERSPAAVRALRPPEAEARGMRPYGNTFLGLLSLLL